jgi:hypothetical protein
MKNWMKLRASEMKGKKLEDLRDDNQGGGGELQEKQFKMRK